MSKVRRDQLRHVTGGNAVHINGESVNIYFARLAYRCAVCFGELEIAGAGVRCAANNEHRRFVRKDDVEKIKQQQDKNVNDLAEFYQIVDGKVIIKNGN